MKAIILAGGEGTRLRPLTATRPKPLMRVGDRTLMDILLERLSANGIREVAVTLGYKGEDIVREIGHRLHGVTVEYRTEKTPLGTAGGVKNCEDFLDSDTLILCADALTNIDFSELIKEHKKQNAYMTLAVTKHSNPSLYGVVKTSEDGTVTEFLEKPPLPKGTEATINCGIYVIKKEVLDFVEKNTFSDFAKDVIPALMANGKRLYAYCTNAFWCDIGSFSEYRRSNLLTLTPDFFVHADKQKINCRGRVDKSIIGKNSRILSSAVVKDSVVGRNTRIGSHTHLDGCILGDCVTVGENVSISAGAVVGDFAIVGDGVTLTDGARIEPYSVFMG